MSAVVLNFPVMPKVSSEKPRPNRVYELRKKAGLSLQQLGELSGVHFTTIGEIERGKRALKPHHMEALAPHLGVLPADLFNLVDGGLTDEERLMIQTYREVPAAMRASMLAVAESQQQFRGVGEVRPIGEDRSVA